MILSSYLKHIFKVVNSTSEVHTFSYDSGTGDKSGLRHGFVVFNLTTKSFSISTRLTFTGTWSIQVIFSLAILSYLAHITLDYS